MQGRKRTRDDPSSYPEKHIQDRGRDESKRKRKKKKGETPRAEATASVEGGEEAGRPAAKTSLSSLPVEVSVTPDTESSSH